MKRSLWVASSVAVLALPVGAMATRTLAGNAPADLPRLQQAIGAASVVDLTTSRTPCHHDYKNGGCDKIGGGVNCHPCD
jgi:hypothetical protein